MVLGSVDIYMQKNEVEHQLTPYTELTQNEPISTWNMPNITSHQGNANQNHNEIPLHPC